MGPVLKNLTQSSNYKYINCLQCFCFCETGSMSKSCNSFGTFEQDCKRAQLSLWHFQVGLSFTRHYFTFMVHSIVALSSCHQTLSSPIHLPGKWIPAFSKWFRMQYPSLRKSTLKYTVPLQWKFFFARISWKNLLQNPCQDCIEAYDMWWIDLMAGRSQHGHCWEGSFIIAWVSLATSTSTA